MGRATACCLLLLLLLSAPALSAPEELRTIASTRVDTAPVLDGRLDDACWQAAPVAGDFRRFTEGTPAHEQSEARIVHSATHLFLAFQCAEPRMDLVRQHVDENPAAFNYAYGNTVEIFLDPGGSKRHYWQFMVNTNGAKKANLATHDVLHLGKLEWEAAVHLGADSFSVEIAVPFALLHLKPGAGTVWGVNFCRARQIGKQESAYMYSSWQPMRGSFLRPELFGTLSIDADFSRYCFGVAVPERCAPGQRCLVEVTNLSGREARVRLQVTLCPLGGVARSGQLTLRLGKGMTTVLDAGRCAPDDRGAEIRVAIEDAASGTLLFTGSTQTVDVTVEVRSGRGH